MEVGVRFQSSISGFIRGVSFYKGITNTGVHIGDLWDSSGNLLASATFTNESASGWQQVWFATPVIISPNTTYVASYFAPAGNYAQDLNYFSLGGVDSPPLEALASAVASGNGVYAYGTQSTFPSATFFSSNYWVDVIYDTAPVSVPENVTASAGVNQVALSWAPSVGATSYTVQRATVSGGPYAVIASGVTSTTYLDANVNTGITYYYVVAAANSGGGVSANSVEVNAQAAGPMQSCSNCITFWGQSANPIVADKSLDGSGVELGLIFTSSIDGTVNGVRFYKGAGNVGTHIGNLWSASGVNLATATFTSETTSGWQEVDFAQPVQITANTNYVVSYYAPNGNYAQDLNYFATTGVSVPPLQALSSVVTGGNGVYAYGASSSFPTLSYYSSNYWVDLVFSPSQAVVGNTNTTGTPDSNDSGHISAFPVIASSNGSFNSISIYVGPAQLGAEFQVAVYADAAGQPGQLLAFSTSVPLQGNSWNSADISAAVTAGSTYWLAYNASGVDPTQNNVILNPSQRQYVWTTASFGSWPNPFGVPAGSSLGTAAMYATYAPQSGSTVSLGVLNNHTVLGDPTNNNALVSWLSPQSSAFATTVGMAIDFLVNRSPGDPNTGLPAYYCQSYLNVADPPTVSNYQYNPAGLLSMFIDSGIGWYNLSGDSRLLELAQQLANFQLANGLTSSAAAWPSVPYAASTAATVPYDGAEGGTVGTGTGTPGVIEPDKIGEVGYQLARLYEATGNQNYLTAAIQDADVLAANVQVGNATQSPWPFRVVAQTGAVVDSYTADMIRPIQLFDELINLGAGNSPSYASARSTAWQWLMSYPIQNNVWANYFEDIPGNISNYNQYVPLETARYLLLNPASDPNSLTKAQALLSWVKSTFGTEQFGATTIAEQLVFPYPMGSHTARYGSVLALLARTLGDAAMKDEALRSLNWATYMLRSDEEVIVGPAVPLTYNQIWFSDGYGDYIRHFVSAMATFPEWASGISQAQ